MDGSSLLIRADMSRHIWEGALAAVAWALALYYVGVPPILAVLIPVDFVLVTLAALRWRSL